MDRLRPCSRNQIGGPLLLSPGESADIYEGPGFPSIFQLFEQLLD